MVQPKISVIVPIYKVEPYLRKCLDSIVNQTYRNLEIILVDDGSPDNCGKICDEYTQKDLRIQVIHKENGGLSSARNIAIDKADGDYLAFVDSDDWLDTDMFEYLLSNVLSENADIGICGRYEEYENRFLTKGYPGRETLDKESALQILLRNDLIQNFVWDKLWKRELFDNIRFPAGRTYEDLAVVHRLFERAEVILCLPEAKYHYLQRSDSIVGDVSLQNRFNHYISAKQRYNEMIKNWPQFQSLLEGQCVASAIGIWCSWLSNPYSERNRYRQKTSEIALFCKEHYRQAIDDMNLGITGRLAVYLTPYDRWWAFILADVLRRVYKLKHGRDL